MCSLSSKYYSVGDVIEVCSPFVHSLNYDCKTAYCDYCIERNQSLKKCSNCEQMFYCDRKCQLNDWKCHKLECHLFAKHRQQIKAFIEEVDDYRYFLVLRLYLLLNKYPSLATNKYSLNNGSETCFNRLMSHENQLKYKFVLNPYCNRFLALMNEIGVNISIQVFHRLLGKISINSFGLFAEDITRKEIGCGLYITISVFNHSCEANAIYINCGTTMRIRTVTQIKPNQEIFLCYVSLDLPKIERQKLLFDTKCFQCSCVRCVSDFDQKFNYKKLSELCEQFNQLKYEANMDKKSIVKVVNGKLNLGEQILDVKKELYAYYNHNISFDMFVHSMNLLDAINYGVCGQTRDSVKPFIESTREYISITHGTEHGLYKLFVHIITNNNIRL